MEEPDLKPHVPADFIATAQVLLGLVLVWSGARKRHPGRDASLAHGCFTRCNEWTKPALDTSSDINVHATHRDCKALAP